MEAQATQKGHLPHLECAGESHEEGDGRGYACATTRARQARARKERLGEQGGVWAQALRGDGAGRYSTCFANAAAEAVALPPGQREAT